ncbi:hypothetical protein HELRODRAFT_143818, partial [Helobdella robusta]|uniref:EGF-like domain-containing protein n=1 Tax=Helobdella robusta TaxID=6412 RepID=T1EJC5_HELRO
IDECMVDNSCNPLTSDCVNLFGSYECQCKSGFESAHCKPDLKCRSSPCKGIGSICQNKKGTYKCSCMPGFKMIDLDVCEDINECLDNQPCGRHQCQNLDGTFTCICPTGFMFSIITKNCEDVDECQMNRCDKLTTDCENTVGSFRCVCKEGY